MKLDHRPRLPRYNVEGVSALPSFKLFGGNNFASWDTRFQHCVREGGKDVQQKSVCGCGRQFYGNTGCARTYENISANISTFLYRRSDLPMRLSGQ